ncbi:MAG TPA: MCE family protein [Bacteroides sp.]|nr:MCE family protein [Bacteroides sp.]
MRLSSEIKIGIIITTAIAATIWGLNFLKGRNILTRVDTYYAVFNNIGGLEKNSKIFISGYNVGQVGDIVFNLKGNNSLIVSLEIEKQYKLPVPSSAILYDADFMGTKAVEIILGSSDDIHISGDTLEATVRAGLTDQLEQQLSPVKDKAENLIVTVDSLMSAMAYVFDRESADLLKSSIQKMESSVDGMEVMLAKDGKLNLLISNMESITENLKNHNEELAAAMSNIESITDSIAKSDLKETINNTNRTLEQTHQILEKINDGEGTIGMLINNDTLYRNIESLSKELELLLKDLQENPKKYVNVSVFGKSDKKEKK